MKRNNILENIKEIMNKKGYSQEYVAKKVGLEQSGFSLILSGKRELKYRILLSISNVLEEDIVDVINYPNKPSSNNGVISGLIKFELISTANHEK